MVLCCGGAVLLCCVVVCRAQTLRNKSDASMGSHVVLHGPRLLLEDWDAASISDSDKVTLKGWGNFRIVQVTERDMGEEEEDDDEQEQEQGQEKQEQEEQRAKQQQQQQQDGARGGESADAGDGSGGSRVLRGDWLPDDNNFKSARASPPPHRATCSGAVPTRGAQLAFNLPALTRTPLSLSLWLLVGAPTLDWNRKLTKRCSGRARPSRGSLQARTWPSSRRWSSRSLEACSVNDVCVLICSVSGRVTRDAGRWCDFPRCDCCGMCLCASDMPSSRQCLSSTRGVVCAV